MCLNALRHSEFDYMSICLTPVIVFVPQYSQKEDKYEEEIKVLTDKLKEVKFHSKVFILGCRPRPGSFIQATCAFSQLD